MPSAETQAPWGFAHFVSSRAVASKRNRALPASSNADTRRLSRAATTSRFPWGDAQSWTDWGEEIRLLVEPARPRSPGSNPGETSKRFVQPTAPWTKSAVAAGNVSSTTRWTPSVMLYSKVRTVTVSSYVSPETGSYRRTAFRTELPT